MFSSSRENKKSIVITSTIPFNDLIFKFDLILFCKP